MQCDQCGGDGRILDLSYSEIQMNGTTSISDLSWIAMQEGIRVLWKV